MCVAVHIKVYIHEHFAVLDDIVNNCNLPLITLYIHGNERDWDKATLNEHMYILTCVYATYHGNMDG